MGFFECCHKCIAPKRHPGCHSECPEYIEQRKLLDQRNEAEKQRKFEDSLVPAPRSKVKDKSKFKYTYRY